MESKKIKKLTLKKEMISNLSESEQNRIMGGGSESAAHGECDCWYRTEQLNCWTGYGFCTDWPTGLCCSNHTAYCPNSMPQCWDEIPIWPPG